MWSMLDLAMYISCRLADIARFFPAFFLGYFPILDISVLSYISFALFLFLPFFSVLRLAASKRRTPTIRSYEVTSAMAHLSFAAMHDADTQSLHIVGSWSYRLDTMPQ